MNLSFPKTFMESSPVTALQTPGPDKTGPVPAPPSEKLIPVEKLLKEMAEEKIPAGNGRPAALPRQETFPAPMPAGTSAPQNPPKK
jgi:hypothetical protein